MRVQIGAKSVFNFVRNTHYTAAGQIYRRYLEWEDRLSARIQVYLLDNWTVFDSLKGISWNQIFTAESANDYRNYETFVSSSETSASRLRKNEDQDFERDVREWDD